MLRMIQKIYGPSSVSSLVALMVLSATFTFTSCDNEDKVLMPNISSVDPMEGPVGTVVTIEGRNLSGATVSFNGTSADVTSNSATSIVTAVPANATSGKITITTAGGTATSTDDFEVTIPASPDAPTITSFSPAVAEEGDEVTITGTNLAEVDEVIFNGTAATITSQNATTLVATVPAGATTGQLTVTNSAGSAVARSYFAVGSMDVVSISNFEEEDVEELWSVAEDSDGGITINAFETESNDSFFHLKARDNNSNHWVGGRYFEESMDAPLGVTSSEMTEVWMNVDVKANASGIHVGKMVYAVVEEGGPDGRRNFERDFDVDWEDWKTVSIRVDKYGFWNGSGMTDAATHLPDVSTIWSVALYVKGGNNVDTYDLSYDNLRFSIGGPLGEEVEGHF